MYGVSAELVVICENDIVCVCVCVCVCRRIL